MGAQQEERQLDEAVREIAGEFRGERRQGTRRIAEEERRSLERVVPIDDVGELRLAAALVVKRWESGDLAGAVRNLDRVLDGHSAPIATYIGT